MLDCEVCGAKVNELRRGRCWGCYSRWADSRPVGLGARCVVCGDRRRTVLRSVELLGSWQPTCFNCHGQVIALDAMPATLAELKVALDRERRKRERRTGRPDTRIFQYERRVGQRRDDRAADDYGLIDEEMIVEIVLDELPLAGLGADLDFEEMTRIHELPL